MAAAALAVDAADDGGAGGSASDYYRSDTEESPEMASLQQKYAGLGKNDSLKSTRSLSVFRDPSASRTMARSEEMTYDMYQDIDIDDQATAGGGGSGVGGSGAGESGAGGDGAGVDGARGNGVGGSGAGGSGAGESGAGGDGAGGAGRSGAGGTYSKHNDASRSRGAFQLKTASSSNSLPSITSPVLRDEDFKATLANSLTRKLSSDANTILRTNYSHVVSMDPAGRGSSSIRGSASATSTLESGSGRQQVGGRGGWNALSSASSTSTLTSLEGAGFSGNLRSESETETGSKPGFGRKSSQRSDSGGSGRDVVSYSVSRYSPAEVDTSNSLVRDKNFRAKMAALFAGAGTSASPIPNSAPASLARAKGEHGTRMEYDVESRESTLSRDLGDVATPGESQSSTLESRSGIGYGDGEGRRGGGGGGQSVSGQSATDRGVRSTTPSDLRDVITDGKVNLMAKVLASQGVSLSGRSMTSSPSMSSLDRTDDRRSNQTGSSVAAATGSKFKYSVDGIDRLGREGEGKMEAGSENETETEVRRETKLKLLQDIRNRGTMVERRSSDLSDRETTRGQEEEDEQEEGRNERELVKEETEMKKLEKRREENEEKEVEEEKTKVEVEKREEKKKEGWDMNSRSTEERHVTEITLDQEYVTQNRRSVADDEAASDDGHSVDAPPSSIGSNRMTPRDTAPMTPMTSMTPMTTIGGTSVTVEITDGSETGYSYVAEETGSRNDDESLTTTTTTDRRNLGNHVLVLHLNSDEENTKAERHLSPAEEEDEEEDAVANDDSQSNALNASSSSTTTTAASTTTTTDATASGEYSSSSTTSAQVGDNNNDHDYAPLIARRSNYDRVRRTGAERGSEGAEINGVSNSSSNPAVSADRAGQYKATEDGQERRTAAEGSDRSGASSAAGQRNKISGRQKINHTLSNDSTSGSFMSQTVELSRHGTDTESIASSSNPYRPTGSGSTSGHPRRNIIIKGRDNIRRITATASDNDYASGIDEERGTGSQPIPNRRAGHVTNGAEANDAGNRNSYLSMASIERQNSNMSLSSDESPEVKRTFTPVWAHPQRPEAQEEEGRRSKTNSGLIIKITPEGDEEIVGPREPEKGRPLGAGAGGGGGGGGMYEPNRRRSRQRRSSRPNGTDSSMTDQDDYGHRSSVMRRRMKRHLSKQSIESETEDPGIYSEPEMSHSRDWDSHVTTTRRTTTPVAGIISHARPQSRPTLASDTRRSSSPPLLSRPASVTLTHHRSVTPVAGRISLSRTSSKPEVARSVTPVTGLISVPRPSSRSAGAASVVSGFITNGVPYPQSVPDVRYSPTSPAGSSYHRSVNVLSPDNPELIAVDPELRDAQKTGNTYHITMSIRPIMSASRPGSVVQTFELVDTAVRTLPMAPRSQSSLSNGGGGGGGPGPRTSWFLTENDLPMSRPPTTDPLLQHHHSGGRRSQNEVGFHLQLQGGEQLTHSHRPMTNGLEPTLIVDLGGAPETEVDSPTRRSNREGLPQIQRGSILIKNRIDTSRPQIVDVIATDDDDDTEETDYDDNSNMFSKDYQLRKENPLYASNPDLNRWEEEGRGDDVDTAAVASPTGGKGMKGMVGKRAMRTRSTNSDPRPTISRSSSIENQFQNDDDEFDIDVAVNRRTTGNQFDEEEERGGGGFVGNGNTRFKSSNGMNGYHETSSTTRVTRTELLNGTNHLDHDHHQQQQQQFEHPYNDDEFNMEIKVNRDYRIGRKEVTSSASQGSRMTSSSLSGQRISQSGGERLFAAGQDASLNAQTISTLNIRSLMVGSSSSVKQTIKVDRLEDEILSGLPVDEIRRLESSGDAAKGASPLDFDKVSEQVDMDIVDGKVILTSKARSERIVPIHGSDDMFKRSAVIVTKRIEIDMTLTPQRRQLYELITKRHDAAPDIRNGTTQQQQQTTLDKKETFELYKKFAALADLDRAMAN